MTVFGHAVLCDHTKYIEATASQKTSMQWHSTQKTSFDTARGPNNFQLQGNTCSSIRGDFQIRNITGNAIRAEDLRVMFEFLTHFP